MEPIKINVNVEIGLKQATIDILRRFFGPQILPSASCIGKDEEPDPEKPTEQNPTPEKPKTTVGADPEGTGAEDDDDLPPGNETPAPAPKPVPTEADARQAVKAAKDRGVNAKAIRSYMQETFGIASSVDCPEERRQELIDGLNALAA